MSPRWICPPQDDLSRGLGDLLGYLGDGGVFQHPALRYRRPRLGDDAVILAVLAYRLVGEVGVHFDLVYSRHGIGLGGKPVQVVGLEVRHPDRTGASVIVELLHHLPSGHEVTVVQSGQRPVDQEQVHIIEAEVRERSLERPTGVFWLVEAIV